MVEVGWEIGQKLEAVYPCEVCEDIDFSVRGNCPVDCGCDLLLVAYVAKLDVCFAAGSLNGRLRFLEARLVDIEQDHLCVLGGEVQCNFSADSSGCSGDDHNRAGEPGVSLVGGESVAFLFLALRHFVIAHLKQMPCDLKLEGTETEE